MIQKRIEEIREKLRSHFKIEGDPISFNSNTYQTSFTVCRRIEWYRSNRLTLIRDGILMAHS